MRNDQNTGAGGLSVSLEEVDNLQKLAARYGLQFVESVTDDLLDPALISKVPVEWVRSHCLMPVRIGQQLCVLMADPAKISQREYLELLIGEELTPVIAPASVIRKSIEACYYSKKDTPEDFIQDMGSAGAISKSMRSSSDDLLEVSTMAPVTQLVNLILLEAVKRGASDVHFEPFASRLRVRYRVDGVLYEQASPPKHLEDALVSRLKVMAHMDIAEKRLPQDGMARVRVGEREIDLRVSTVPVAEGERVVLRLLDQDSALLPLAALGMNAGTLEKFNSVLESVNGMVVVSGPTGSGKTTTLYAALGQLDSSRRNILTVEDPIEYQLPNIGQIQVKPRIGMTFANGLRHILRQDPDVILVGETRDAETAEIAVRASLTGHLVFTTLHTNDAAGAVVRLLDIGVEPYLLASCLRAVLSQRLVRRLCDKCKNPTALAEEALQGRVINDARIAEGVKVWDHTGCDSCLEGYRGRTGLFELMLLSPDIQDSVRSGNVNLNALRALAVQAGMVDIVSDGVDKVLAGITSLDEVYSVVAS